MGVLFTNPDALAGANTAVAAVQTPAPTQTQKKKRRANGNTRPRPLSFSLDIPGVRVRVGHWLSLLDIAAPTFYAWREQGKAPPADGNDGRPFWYGQTVRAWLEQRDDANAG